jgi:hypothetical protein
MLVLVNIIYNYLGYAQPSFTSSSSEAHTDKSFVFKNKKEKLNDMRKSNIVLDIYSSRHKGFATTARDSF